MDDELGDEFLGFQQDFELALDPTGTFLDIQTTVDGVGVNGVQVLLYLTDPLGGDVAGPGGVCASGVLVGSAVTETQVAGGVDTPGIAQFGIDPAQSYCAIADPNADLIPTAYTDINVGDEFEEFDPADDIDVIIAEGGLGVLDVQFLGPPIVAPALQGTGGPPVNGEEVIFAIANVGDTATTCAGLPVAFLITGPELVEGVSQDGMASAPVDTSQTYCAMFDPVFSSYVGATTGIVLDAVDEDDDKDAIVNGDAIPVP